MPPIPLIGLYIAFPAGPHWASVERLKELAMPIVIVIAAAFFGGLVLDYCAFIFGAINIVRVMNGNEPSSLASILFYLTRVTQVGMLVTVIVLTATQELWLGSAIILFVIAWINIMFVNRRSDGAVWFTWTAVVMMATAFAQIIIWAGGL